ncbi:Uncharacterized protein GBIM_06594 [Gryllus bimaculatus]|nr:Uncharacterized protein GBIM_06594 [Gryllus bimaculatus]
MARGVVFVGLDEEDDELPKIWYKMNNPLNNNVSEVELGMATNLTSNRVFVTPDHTLVIQNISQKDEGIYFCHGQEGIGKELKYNYLINTILASRHLPTVGNLTQWANYKVQWLQPANNMLHSSMAFRLPELLSKKIQFDVFTEWEEWGPCVSCHKQPAERRRIGKCRLRASQPEMNGKDLLDLPSHIKLFLSISQLSCRSYLVRQIGQEVLGFALWMIPDFIQTAE